MPPSVPILSAGDLGQAVRERRLALALSQQALADRVGVSRQWVVGLEQGKPRGELGLVLRVVRALDLQLRLEPLAEPEAALDALLGDA